MNTLIAARRDELARLCRQFHVSRLELFGSATRDDFDLATSDLDFLVEFEEMPPVEYGNAYFGLLAALDEFTAGKSFAVDQADTLLRSAVERQFEITGEAMGRLAKIEVSAEGESAP